MSSTKVMSLERGYYAISISKTVYEDSNPTFDVKVVYNGKSVIIRNEVSWGRKGVSEDELLLVIQQAEGYIESRAQMAIKALTLFILFVATALSFWAFWKTIAVLLFIALFLHNTNKKQDAAKSR